MCILSHVQLFATPWTVACQTPLSMEFSRQEYKSTWSFPTPRNFPNPGTELASLVIPALASRFITTAPPGNQVQICISWIGYSHLALQIFYCDWLENPHTYYLKEISILKLIEILVRGAMLKMGEEGDRAGKISQGTAYFILN